PLDVAADDVGQFAHHVRDVLFADLLGTHGEERGRGVPGGLGGAGDHDVAVPGAGQRDGGADGARRVLPLALLERPDALGIEVRRPDLIGDFPQIIHGGGDVLAHEFAPVDTRPSRANFSIITSDVKGLMTYSCAPAASARTMWLCSLSVVTMTRVMSRSRASSRAAVTNSSPFMFGMFQSTSARFGTVSMP